MSHSTCALLPGTLPAKQCQHSASQEHRAADMYPLWTMSAQQRERSDALPCSNLIQKARAEAAKNLQSLFVSGQNETSQHPSPPCSNIDGERSLHTHNMDGGRSLHTHSTHNKSCIQSAHKQTTVPWLLHPKVVSWSLQSHTTCQHIPHTKSTVLQCNRTAKPRQTAWEVAILEV